jgi:hypothetical protein
LPAWIRRLATPGAVFLAENNSFCQNKFEHNTAFPLFSAFPPLQKLFLPQRGASQ